MGTPCSACGTRGRVRVGFLKLKTKGCSACHGSGYIKTEAPSRNNRTSIVGSGDGALVAALFTTRSDNHLFDAPHPSGSSPASSEHSFTERCLG